MTIMMSKLYDALRAGEVPEDKARAAAEEAAGYENRAAKIETDLTLLKWMVATNIAISVAVLFKMFV
jgi:phage shock protein A